ncbi:site-specific integrase [Paraburkholderia fungorum]|uniref:site-specific integrase n=1 Tax=Paraburkholderia fungorum TaxID=134537 RepID=UPI00042863AC|nr:site-specific integrase [Paraburkholderia fungorum]PZR48488.1 MAG: integrase [Paraburkholderia fungorum]
MPSIYRHRNTWQASVTVNGRNQKRNFTTRRDAESWACETHGSLEKAHAPLLDGPANSTLARAIYEYAHLYTVHKRGAKQELTLINRYLAAAGLPMLQLVTTNEGGVSLAESQPAADLPKTFATLQGKRAAARKATNASRSALALKPVASISPALLVRFKATMKKDGLSDSTIQKEFALLKHLFNCAQKHWGWAGFENPMASVDIPKGGPGRDVVLTEENETALFEALGRCDNPFILPVVQFAIEATSRRANLLKLRWLDVDLAGRTVTMRMTKAGENQVVPLTQRAVDILSRLPREETDGRVFPLTADALDAAWDRATGEAGLPNLRFHDLRHIGTTRHARRLRNPQMLKRITGHKTDAMLARYTHLFVDDVLQALDATEPTKGTPLAPDHSARRADGIRTEAKSRRLNGRSETGPTIVEPATVDNALASPSSDARERKGHRVVAVDFRNRRRAAA